MHQRQGRLQGRSHTEHLTLPTLHTTLLTFTLSYTTFIAPNFVSRNIRRESVHTFIYLFIYLLCHRTRSTHTIIEHITQEK